MSVAEAMSPTSRNRSLATMSSACAGGRASVPKRCAPAHGARACVCRPTNRARPPHLLPELHVVAHVAFHAQLTVELVEEQRVENRQRQLEATQVSRAVLVAQGAREASVAQEGRRRVANQPRRRVLRGAVAQQRTAPRRLEPAPARQDKRMRFHAWVSAVGAARFSAALTCPGDRWGPCVHRRGRWAPAGRDCRGLRRW